MHAANNKLLIISSNRSSWMWESYCCAAVSVATTTRYNYCYCYSYYYTAQLLAKIKSDTSVFCSFSTDWPWTLAPLISRISSPTWSVPVWQQYHQCMINSAVTCDTGNSQKALIWVQTSINDSLGTVRLCLKSKFSTQTVIEYLNYPQWLCPLICNAYQFDVSHKTSISVRKPNQTLHVLRLTHFLLANTQNKQNKSVKNNHHGEKPVT